MIIKEQKYTILNAEMASSIDWLQTYQTIDTARFSIDNTQFVISIPHDSDYLSELEWINGEETYNIVSADDFSGARPTN
jgi:hypothetical protein